MNKIKLRLDRALEKFAQASFIQADPIQFAHRYQGKQDIEIAAFWVAMISWGRRENIIKAGHRLMQLMDDSPFDFVINHSPKEAKTLSAFYYRTFNGADALCFLQFFKAYYRQFPSMEFAFNKCPTLEQSIAEFHQLFFKFSPSKRSEKHVASPAKNSACKRINMFLRWMVRPNTEGIDLGIWKSIHPSQLFCPLDVHVAYVARELALLTRKSNDWKAVVELTQKLREFDPKDPVKYDLALFGLGMELRNSL